MTVSAAEADSRSSSVFQQHQFSLRLFELCYKRQFKCEKSSKIFEVMIMLNYDDLNHTNVL